MTPFEITALYVALNLLLAIVLSLRVGLVRLKTKTSLGDGGDPALNARIRAHGNFIENAPFGLIGLFALASLGASAWGLHLFGIMLTAGRLLHAQGMAAAGALGKGRPVGTVLTLMTFLGQALALFWLAVFG